MFPETLKEVAISSEPNTRFTGLSKEDQVQCGRMPSHVVISCCEVAIYVASQEALAWTKDEENEEGCVLLTFLLF